MKKVMLLVLVSLLIVGCSVKYKQVGRFNMVSTRNVNMSIPYERLTTYTNATSRDLKRNKAKTIDEAIDAAVKKVPGGEFLMNVKVFAIDTTYYAIEGDVWGVRINNNKSR
ncbi:MAG: hypothetical protein ACOYMA_18150 [Bacteroidia bacterium]